MGLYSVAPKKYETGEIITPESINTNMLSCQETLERFASKKWRRMIVNLFPDRDNQFFMFPLLNTTDYIIERITIFGTYSGQPSLRWDFSIGMNINSESFQLPADGNGGQYYTGTVMPGTFISGTQQGTENGNFTITLDDATTHDLRVCVAIRTKKGAAGDDTDSIMSNPPALYEDQTTLEASPFLDKRASLYSFADTHYDLARPKGLNTFQFFNIYNGSAPQVTNFYHNDPITVTRVKTYVKLTASGQALQEIQVDVTDGISGYQEFLNVAGSPSGSTYEIDSGVISFSPSGGFYVQVRNLNGITTYADVWGVIETIKTA